MAGDFGINTAANLASELVKLVASEASYSFKFKRYFKDFETEKENLESRIESVVDRAEKAKKKAEKIDNEVEQWLNDADLLIARVVELEGKVEWKKNISCFGRFPNLFRRYRLAKKLENMKQTIIGFNNKQFSQFSHRDSIMGMKYYSSEGFQYFNSTKLAYNQLLEALRRDEVRIGLYGIGGCGKTSLVQQVGKAAEEEKLFDKVVFAVVSRPVNIRQIQGNIAGSLDYKLDEEEVTERAKRLNQRLITGEKILIILDDVWEILNFEKIGIPFDNNQKKCRVLLTTRREDVCKSMDCKPIPLGLLTEEEALTLFRKHANITGDTSEVEKKNSLAVEITKECGGLPVAIKPLAITLKGKSLIQWEQALKALKEFTAVDIVSGEENPYKCLQLSYDMLEKSGAKSLFLFCSLFAEDEQISVESLIRFAFGLDMFQNVNSYKDARTEVGAAIKELVYSSLLFEDEEEQCVKMHDLVRDVALWLANKEKITIISREMDLKALAEKATTKDTKFLCCDSTSEFSNKLDCPKLEMMIMIHKDEGSLGVLNAILEGKKDLKVLVLVSESEKSWETQSIHLLTNLRYLLLSDFIFNDMSFVGKLNTLTTLQFNDCEIIELPNEIAELKRLRLLSVSSCTIGGNPYQVLGKCSKLEELYFYKNEFSEREAVIENLAEVFQKNNSFPVPQRYWLDIGDTPYYRDNLASNILTICPFDVQMISNAAIKNLFQTAEEIYLGYIKGCKCIVPDIFQAGEGFEELITLNLKNSGEIECLFDNTKDHLQRVGTGFPKLAKLIIKSMRCMETLCRGPPPHGLFDELKLLELVDCPMLTYLFTPALAQNLVLLEEMEIKECHGLKHIVDEEEQEEIRNADDKLLFPKLKHLKVRECNQLEYLFHVSHARGLLQLKILRIEEVPKLKYVIGECYHEDQFRYQNQNQIEYQSIELPLLEELTLSNLQSIITICPENYRVMWSSLQVFRVKDCPELSIMSINNCMIGSEMIQDSQGATIREELAMMNPLQNVQNIERLVVSNCKIQGIFNLEELAMDGQQVTSKLRKLTLLYLPDLRYILMGPKQIFSLQNVEVLKISGCGKLKCIFSATVLKSLPQLWSLHIEDCLELEQIFEQDEENQNGSKPHNQEVCFPQLVMVFVKGCGNLKRLFSISTHYKFPKLNLLLVNGSSKLEQLFAGELGGTDKSMHSVLPELRYLILTKLPSLASIFSLGIQLQPVEYCIVQHCPKLALSSTTTLEILQDQFRFYDEEIKIGVPEAEQSEGIAELIRKIVQSDEYSEIEGTHNDNPTPEDVEYQDEEALESVMSSSQESIEEAMQQSVEEDHKPETTAGVTIATDSKTENPLTGPLLKTRESSPQSIIASDKEVPTSKTTMTVKETENGIFQHCPMSEEPPKETSPPSQEINSIKQKEEKSPKSKKAMHKEYPQELASKDQQVLRETRSDMGVGAESTKENVEVGPTLEKAKIESSSVHTGSLEQDPLVTSLHETAPKIIQESEKEIAQKCSTLEKPAIATSSTESELRRPTPKPLPNVDETQKPTVLEISTSDSEPKKSSPGSLVIYIQEAFPPSQIQATQTENYVDKDSTEADPENLHEFEGDDLFNLLQSMEEVGDVKNPALEDSLVLNALADLEACLRMPLKDIANSEANSLHLENALNILSHCCYEDGALLAGLKARIDSIIQNVQNLLSSFKQVSATIHEFKELEEREKSIKEELPRHKEAATTFISRIFKAKKSMAEAQQKKADLEEKISKLQAELISVEKEIIDCNVNLSSLQQKKEKFHTDVRGFKEEFEFVKKRKSQMVEDQRKAQQKLFKLDSGWSALYSEFEKMRTAAANQS